MHKKLHKNLYSKKNKKKNYPFVNNKSIIPSYKFDNETEERLTLVSKKNRYLIPIFSSLIVTGLIIFVNLSFNSSSESEINLLTVESKNTIVDSVISSTTSTSTTTSSTTPTTTLISSTTTTVPIIVKNISDAQNQLIILGLYSGEINNELNNETKAALKEFQRLAGLTVDGILGPKTIAALEKGEDSYIGIGGADVNNVEVIIYSKEIETAQKTLKELNLYNGEIDGINGKGTKSAIKEFQKLAGLTIDGVLGPNTKAALEKGEDSYVSVDIIKSVSTSNDGTLTVDLINYDPNGTCIVGYVNEAQIWVPDPCFYPVFVFRYGQTAQVNSQAELDAYLSQNWSLTKEKTYNSLGEVPTQNYTKGINSPVNGLIMPSGSNNSIVIGIKNDNNVNARPQSGPQNADAVFEVLVEGGMTRFINIFYQSDTTYHGPIRSARPTDPTVLRPLGGVLVASGATGGLIPEIVDMGVPVITDRRPDYFRISSRKAPHNLYADTSKLKSTAISRGYRKTNTPQPLFPWGEPSFDNWKTNSYLTLTFSGYTETTWTWNGSNYVRTYYDAYKNQKSDNVHYWSDLNGNTGQISFKTVIALFCEPYVHPLQLPSVKTVGEGRAIILHGGKMLDAKWKRGSNLDPFHIVDSNNNILYVPKGKVWISLVPNTKKPSFG